jgi:DNA-binding transcriptional LysR family regulator
MPDMNGILDISPLRSLVAIADCDGFRRAATQMHLSQSAVSQHVRRLETVVGRSLIERHGRGSRFTADGERLLAQARRILALHDETLRGFGGEAHETFMIGSTEHAAAQILPALSAALERSAARYRFRYRLDRGSRLAQELATEGIDLALLLNVPGDTRALPVGDLELTWYSAPGWTLPAAPQPIPVVAFDDPCALRSRALQTLSRHDMPAIICAEAGQLAGVQAAVGSGLGVALMATLGRTPDGLVARDDLPRPEPLTLYVCPRPGLDEVVAHIAADAIRPLLPVASARGAWGGDGEIAY